MGSPDPHPHSPLSSLERLPLHIFEYICSYLPRRSLFSLSLASKTCRRASARGRFSRIVLTIWYEKKLRTDLERWNAILGQDDLFRCVRRLVLIGKMADTVRTRVYRPLWMDNEDENAGEEEGEDAGDSEDEGGNGRRVILTARSSESESPPSPWSVSMDNDNASDSEDEEDSYNVGFNPGFLTLSPEYKQAQHQAWLPFVPFLKKLPGLTDVVWACRDLVPACVLTALHEHHPTVRLHVRTFSLRSLYQEQNQLHDVDPDEYSLVTSPCLTSIRTSVQGYDDEGRFSFNVEALKHILQRGYAPNLRYLRIRYTSTSGTIALVEALRAPRGPWRGFFHDRPAQEPPADWKGAQLETLIINDNPGPWRFRSWMECIDPIFLRRFEYTWVLSLDGLQILVSLAESGQLRSLRQLVITLNVTDNNGRDLPNDHDDIRDRLAAQLFRCLPPLETLKLLGSDISAQTFEGLLERHGPTLRKLHLPFYDLVKQPDQDLDKVRSIQRHCPRLEDIHLGIRRRHGNAQEVAMYRTLGKLPRLRRANLILDCTVPSDKLTHNFNVKREERIAEVLYKLKNLAVDETLARAIYKEISSSGCAATLERLTLEPKVRHGRVIHGDGFSPWLDWVIRSWLITRNVVRDEEVVVREIKSHYIDWEARREELEEYRENEVETWRRLWPSKGGNWMDEWHSFPLDTEGADALVT